MILENDQIKTDIWHRTPSGIAWILASEFAGPVIIGLAINAAVKAGHDTFGYVTGLVMVWGFLIARVVLLILDHMGLKKLGYNIPAGYAIAGFFIMGIYLFVRAKRTNARYGYFILWTAPIIISVLLITLMTVFLSRY